MGNNIKALRIASKKTQTQVARDLGVNIETYRSWEQGKRNPSGRMIIQLAEYFGVTTDTVIGTQFAETVHGYLTPEEQALVDTYRLLSNEGKVAVHAVAHALSMTSFNKMHLGQ